MQGPGHSADAAVRVCRARGILRTPRYGYAGPGAFCGRRDTGMQGPGHSADAAIRVSRTQDLPRMRDTGSAGLKDLGNNKTAGYLPAASFIVLIVLDHLFSNALIAGLSPGTVYFLDFLPLAF